MRSDWASRFALEYLAFRAAGRFFLFLGLERASNFSGTVWRHIAPWSKRHGRALDHLAAAFPAKTEIERDAICRDMWENLGRTFAEAFFLDELLSADRVTYENLEAFETWARVPGGRVACTGHLANWELTPALAIRRGMRPWSIYQKIKNPLVDRDVTAMRSRLYTGGLVVKSPGVPRQFLRIVREGGTVGVMVDLRDRSGIAVPFFGRPAPSTVFPALLAHSAGSPILVCCMRRLPGIRFVQSFELVELPETGDRKADIANTTVTVQNVLERFIRQWPEQWMWAHRRWG